MAYESPFHTVKNNQYLITACDVYVPKMYESLDLPKQETPRNACGKYSKCGPKSFYFAIPQAFGCLSYPSSEERKGSDVGKWPDYWTLIRWWRGGHVTQTSFRKSVSDAVANNTPQTHTLKKIKFKG